MGHLSREVFLAAKKLQWVQSPSSGVNYFLAIPELKDGPVILTGARGTHAASVADSAMAMILAITRGIRRQHPGAAASTSGSVLCGRSWSS